MVETTLQDCYWCFWFGRHSNSFPKFQTQKKKKKIPRNVSVLSFVSIVTIKPKSTLGDVCFAFPPLMPSTFYMPGTELMEGKRSWCLRSTQTTVGLCGDQRQQKVPTFSRHGEVQPLIEVFSSTRFPWSHPARWEQRVVFLFLCLHNKYWGLRHLCVLPQEWLSFRNGRLRCLVAFRLTAAQKNNSVLWLFMVFRLLPVKREAKNPVFLYIY